MTISVIAKSMLTRSVAIIAPRLALSGTGEILVFAMAAVGAIVASIARVPGMIGLLGAGLALVMLTIAAIDRRRFIIPNALTVGGFALGIFHAAAQEPDAVLRAIALATTRGLVFAILLLILRAVYVLVRGREGLGLGDVKLAGVAGIWLDWPMMPIAIEIAAGAALSVFWIRQFALGQSFSRTTRLPFGLFFAPAIWISWVLEMSPFG
jgi:leader peptidase (prepilin peptidase) / N-methyltransferase